MSAEVALAKLASDVLLMVNIKPDQEMNLAEAAAHLGLSRSTMEERRKNNQVWKRAFYDVSTVVGKHDWRTTIRLIRLAQDELSRITLHN